MHKFIYALLLCGACGFALWRGDRDNRVAAGVCIIASVLSPLVVRPLVHRYVGVEVGLLIVDVAAFTAFTLIALSSCRFWPLWLAGFQLSTLVTHLSAEIDIQLVPQAYAVAAKSWSYLILIMLAVGSWRAQRRRLAGG